MIKIVFVDFDDTLYSHSSSSIPQSALDAFDLLRKNNIKLFLCTGRSLMELKQFDTSNLVFDGMILNNGLMAYDENMNFIYNEPISGQLKEKAIKMFEERKIPVYLSTKDDMILNFVNNKIIEVQEAVSSDLPDVKPYNNEDFYMATAFADSEEQFNEILSLQDIAEITFWHIGAFDIVTKNMSKATGIEKVLKHYNIDISETMAIGDGQNDIEMLKKCQIGVAMGNSDDDVKIAANYVTSHIDDNGIYNALKYYNLI